MTRPFALILAGLAWVLCVHGGPATAGEKKLSAAEITEALSGNTVEGLWGRTEYKSYFDAGGLTLYQARGMPVEHGKWRADETSDQYCSWWPRSGWGCYDIYRDGDLIIWAIPGTETRYPSTLLKGNRL